MSEPETNRNFLIIPEAANKVIQCLRVFHDSRDNSREIEIEFADGTELSIEVQAKTAVIARLVSLENGDCETLKEYSDEPRPKE